MIGQIFFVPLDSSITEYVYIIVGGKCDGQTVNECKTNLENVERNRLLNTVNTKETCELAGHIWYVQDKYPQLPTYLKSKCELTHELSCKTDYKGRVPIAVNCFWDYLKPTSLQISLDRNNNYKKIREKIKSILRK